MSQNRTIRIRVNIEENDSLFKKFNAFKKKIAINTNTELVRYMIKKICNLELAEIITT